MKRLVRNGAIITSATLFLASCSNGVKSQESNSKYISMGNIFNSDNEHISYILSDDNPIEKDSTIQYYIVTKNGKAKVYDGTEDTTLGDVSRMDEDKIKDRMRKEDKEWFNKDKKETIDYLKNGVTKVNEVKQGFKGDDDIIEDKKTYKNTKEYVDKHGNVPQKYLNKVKNSKYKEPEFNQLETALETDGSGNKSKKEGFKFLAHGFHQGNYDAPKDGSDKSYYMETSVTNSATYEDKLELTEEYEDTVAVTDIYDKKYAGLSYLDEDDEDTANYLVTEVGDKTKEVKFDTPKADFIDIVDGKKK